MDDAESDPSRPFLSIAAPLSSSDTVLLFIVILVRRVKNEWEMLDPGSVSGDGLPYRWIDLICHEV